MRGSCIVIALFLLTLSIRVDAATSRREPANDGANAQLQMMMQQLRGNNAQLSQENARLESDLSSAQKEVENLSKKLSTSSSSLKEEKRKLGQQTARSGALAAQNEELRLRLQELSDRYRQLAETLQSVEGERARLERMTVQYDERVVFCERNNEDLYALVQELSEQYERKGFFRVLRQKEPVTGLGRVQMQNRMDEYRQLAEDMRLAFSTDDTAELRADELNDERAAN